MNCKITSKHAQIAHVKSGKVSIQLPVSHLAAALRKPGGEEGTAPFPIRVKHIKHSKDASLEIRRKVLLYVFVHDFFLGVCKVFHFRYKVKANLRKACLY